MPVFQAGTPVKRRKAEARRTQGSQLQSLTFIERDHPFEEFDTSNHPFGLLVESVQNNFLMAGFQTRSQERNQIGNRDGRVYDRPYAIAPGRTGMDLVFNPALQPHRELATAYAPEAGSPYLVKSVMAPPFMNMMAGPYEHRSSSPVMLDPDNQATMNVEFLNNYGEFYIPARLYRKTSQARVARITTYTFRVLTESDSPLPVGEDNAGTTTAISADTLTVAVDDSSGSFQITVPSGPDIAALSTSYDGVILMHAPGDGGGYQVSANMAIMDLSSAEGIGASDAEFAKRLNDNQHSVIYLGIYSTPVKGILYQDTSA